MIFDWENITKEECLLCILRDKETKRAKRYEWTPLKREETKKRIEEINATRENEYYEICDDEDMRILLPLPLSRRQCDLNDIYQELRDINRELEDDEYDISHTRNVIEEMNEKLDKYIETYAREGE
jgi:hypothetical protein